MRTYYLFSFLLYNTDVAMCKSNSWSIQATDSSSTSLGYVSGLPAPVWLPLSDSFKSRIVDLAIFLTVDSFKENVLAVSA